MNGTRKFVDTRLFLLTALYAFVALALVAGQDPPLSELLGRLVTLVILWLLVTFALGAAADFLLNRLLARWELRPKRATGSRAKSGHTTGEALYLKYLRLRAVWTYPSDPMRRTMTRASKRITGRWRCCCRATWWNAWKRGPAARDGTRFP